MLQTGLSHHMSDSQNTKVALAMAAFRSHLRHQREADHWLDIYERRTAALGDEEREELRRRTVASQIERRQLH